MARRLAASSQGLTDVARTRVVQDPDGLPHLGDGTPYRVGMLVRLPQDTLQTPPTRIEWVNRPREKGEPWTAVTRGRGTWPLNQLVAEEQA